MRIPAPHGHLEAHLREAVAPVRGVAVVCHPHPLHGGTMHTKAVFRAAQALSEAGFHALRFNFRGVGTSTGAYDEGRGERDDVRAALDWLVGAHPGVPVLAGGFSFGSMVGLAVGGADDRVRGLLAMGLPVELYGLGPRIGSGKPLLVVQGEEDEFGSGEALARALADVGDSVTLVRIDGAGHFFDDHFDELKAAIREYFTEGPGAEAFPVLGE